jgi:hypothetical protein
MYKIAICVRNRLGITRKCLEAILKHSKIEHEIYIYDNLTNYRLTDHVLYFNKLFQKNIIQQYTVNSDKSTFNAFSKVVALNQFGYNHLMDPRKDQFSFLVFLDNDMIVMPNWDEYLYDAWSYLNSQKNKNIKIVTQYPGGIKYAKLQKFRIKDKSVYTGKLSGSGLWAVNTNFFSDVGFLNCKDFLHQHKKHDQVYWNRLRKIAKNNDYVLAIQGKIALHAGGMVGSICNQLDKEKIDKRESYEKIKFKEVDAKIEKLSFDDFFKAVEQKTKLFKW